MTLDEIEQHARRIANSHIGVFSNIDGLKAEIFNMVIALVEHVRRLEAVNANAAARHADPNP
jgi:hypothetical protein